MARTLAKANRRLLRFENLDDVMVDVAGLAAAEAAGGLRTSGNWTFGQSLNHLATWVDYAYDGLSLRVPLPLRLVLRLMRDQVLYKPMRPGSRIPRVPGGTLAIDAVPTEAAIEHFNRSFARLKVEPPTRPHVAFGRMNHDQWIAMNLRHSELHLSYFNPPA
jgi:hypothetical protein